MAENAGVAEASEANEAAAAAGADAVADLSTFEGIVARVQALVLERLKTEESRDYDQRIDLTDYDKRSDVIEALFSGDIFEQEQSWDDNGFDYINGESDSILKDIIKEVLDQDEIEEAIDRLAEADDDDPDAIRERILEDDAFSDEELDYPSLAHYVYEYRGTVVFQYEIGSIDGMSFNDEFFCLMNLLRINPKDMLAALLEELAEQNKRGNLWKAADIWHEENTPHDELDADGNYSDAARKRALKREFREKLNRFCEQKGLSFDFRLPPVIDAADLVKAMENCNGNHDEVALEFSLGEDYLLSVSKPLARSDYKSGPLGDGDSLVVSSGKVVFSDLECPIQGPVTVRRGGIKAVRLESSSDEDDVCLQTDQRAYAEAYELLLKADRLGPWCRPPSDADIDRCAKELRDTLSRGSPRVMARLTQCFGIFQDTHAKRLIEAFNRLVKESPLPARSRKALAQEYEEIRFESPLHAVNPAQLIALFDEGLSLEHRDRDGNTPLMDACRRGDHDLVAALLERGAKVNVRNKMGHTPLTVYLSSRMISHSHRIFPEPGSGKKGEASEPRKGVLQLLLEHGENPNPTEPDVDYLHPALAQVLKRNSWGGGMDEVRQALQLLHHHGARLNEWRVAGRPALLGLLDQREYQRCAELIKLGADVEVRTQPNAKGETRSFAEVLAQTVAAFDGRDGVVAHKSLQELDALVKAVKARNRLRELTKPAASPRASRAA